jgi:hypothetical protein
VFGVAAGARRRLGSEAEMTEEVRIGGLLRAEQTQGAEQNDQRMAGRTEHHSGIRA